MKIPTTHKEVILKKVNILIKEFLVNRYLKYDYHADNTEFELLRGLTKKLLSIQEKIKSDENIDIQFLMWIDGEYQKLYNENMEKQI